MLPAPPASVAMWPNRMLKLGEVITLTGLSKATIYDWMEKGLFPRSRRLGPNRVAWETQAITGWLNERPLAA